LRGVEAGLAIIRGYDFIAFYPSSVDSSSRSTTSNQRS